MNSVSLIGRLGQNPELKYTPSGTALAKFSLAVDGRKGQNGEKETHWIDCVAWQKTAEVIAEHCQKGKQIGVNGRLNVNQWEDQEGQKHKRTEVVVDSFTFCGSKEGGASSTSSGTQKATPKQQSGSWGSNAGFGSDEIDMDDVPF